MEAQATLAVPASPVVTSAAGPMFTLVRPTFVSPEAAASASTAGMGIGDPYLGTYPYCDWPQ
jgi:hypothetical protein